MNVIVTGASSGLGLETSAVLAERGIDVVMACRDPGRAELARTSVATRAKPGAVLRVAPLDLADPASVRRFVEVVGAEVSALVCNAGVQVVGEPRRTREGLEETFASNHLGHFLLARLLLPRMAHGGRIVFVSSNTHDPRQWTGMPAPRPDDLEGLARGTAFSDEPAALAGRRRYTTSKLCNVLCAYELDRRLRASCAEKRLHVLAFDPGLMPGTGLAREYGRVARWLWRGVAPAMTLVLPNVNSIRTSARRLADVATGARFADESGVYVSRGRIGPSSARSHDEALARRLWARSSRWVGLPEEIERGDIA